VRRAAGAIAALIFAGCANQMEPAQRSISDIEVIVSATSPEAAQYVPDQLADVQSKLDGLKASFAKKDYAAVLAAAPADMNAAQGLAAAAAAKRGEIAKSLSNQWSALAAEVPASLAALRDQLDRLAKQSNRRLAAGIDVEAAQSRLSDASSLWSKAQAAFATGNLDEAVTTARRVETLLHALAPTVKLPTTPPSAAAR